MRHHIFLLLPVLFCYFSLSATNDVRLRLVPKLYDANSQSVFVELEMAYEGNGEFSIADQNYRIYFDTHSLRIDTKHCNSDLPQDRYSDLQFHQVVEDVNADRVNQLSFDDELGFINFSIDLINDQKGGLSLRKKHGWERIAILKFNLIDTDPSEIVWSREEATGKYATAFVQIMEWLGPNHIRPANIIDYKDLEIDVDESIRSILSYTVSPNPATNFVRIELEEVTKGADLQVMDNLGVKVYSLELAPDTKFAKIPVDGFTDGSYSIEIKDKNTGIRVVEKFVKVNK